MKGILWALPFAALLSGCEEAKYPQWEVNQELRHQLFVECLGKIPSGPLSTTFNDWSEVVDSCENAARFQSLYCYANCNPEPPQRSN